MQLPAINGDTMTKYSIFDVMSSGQELRIKRNCSDTEENKSSREKLVKSYINMCMYVWMYAFIL